MSQIDLVKLVKKFSERWMVTSALMIAGGLLGLFVSQIKAPLFESSAVFSVTIDYTQTGALSDIQEDQAMRGVGSLILSESVIEETLSKLNNEGDTGLSRAVFLDNSFLDREDFRWTLRYRDPDPKIADMAVKAWSKSADEIIQEGLTHSLTSLMLQEELENLKTCLFDLSNGDILESCGNRDLDSVLNSLNEISTQIQAEKAASRGLFHALSVSLVNDGAFSQKDVLGQRNLFVVSGALVGLVLNILTVLMAEIKRSRSI